MNNNKQNIDSQLTYTSDGGVNITRLTTKCDYSNRFNDIVDKLNDHLGMLLVSNFEYPGRYTQYDIGFINPPLKLTANGDNFKVSALNDRGLVLLAAARFKIQELEAVKIEESNTTQISGSITRATKRFNEENRSQQPSIFSVVRAIIKLFASNEDTYLGLYGSFGYDVAFQFEPIKLKLNRDKNQRDLVLYLPDQILVVDHRKETAIQYSYDFTYQGSSTQDLDRSGSKCQYIPNNTYKRQSDHEVGEYAKIVEVAKEYFKRGDLFEVVPGQMFSDKCALLPSELFLKLMVKNPSPYSFFINLGEMEYLVGASPEMYVRVNGKRVETCPISGTIKRGSDAITDAENILKLLSSKKEESELTMCTDVDRNDKSRVCMPGSVKVIGRRQLELYSRVIHTVDHVEGQLKDNYDAIDAFLTHTWAVTVTGAPKPWAMQFIENHEKSPRLWYGGAVGVLNFNGNMNTGLTIRTIRIKDGVGYVRAGATLLYDSIPEDEEAETELKASAMLDALSGVDSAAQQTNSGKASYKLDITNNAQTSNAKKRVLLVDHQDSFVHTLANYLGQVGLEVITLRSGFTATELQQINPDLVVLSPGPGKPEDFDLKSTIDMCIKAKLPIFGVCLGLQGVVEYFGGELDVLDYPMHGKPVTIHHQESSSDHLLKGLPDTFTVGLYHSLYAIKDKMPNTLNVTALSDSGIVMAVEHKTLPVWAVQFHPESILSFKESAGLKIIENVVKQI